MGRQTWLKEAMRMCVISLLFAQQVVQARAFTREPGAAPSATQEAPAQAQVGQPGQHPLNDPLALPATPPGTELNIPGIGSVGILPKLDFGLELLYSPKSQTDGGSGVQLDQHAPDDMQIKGTFTHKF
jgi:hypothetical protein